MILTASGAAAGSKGSLTELFVCSFCLACRLYECEAEQSKLQSLEAGSIWLRESLKSPTEVTHWPLGTFGDTLCPKLCMAVP